MKCKYCGTEMERSGSNRNGARYWCPNKKCPVVLAKAPRFGEVKWYLEAQSIMEAPIIA